MGRYRGRSRSYSPSTRRSSRSISPGPPPPRRHYYDDDRSKSHRDRRRSPAPSGLLVRNISLAARPEDLRIPFERFGAVKDVYLPKNYYTGESRGFGFVKFHNGEDAAEAKHHLNHTVIGGREIAIVFAAENRKTPWEMRTTGCISNRHGGSSRRPSPPRFLRRRNRSYSPSPSPGRHDSRDRKARDYSSPSRSRSISRSVSPHDENAYKSGHKSTSSRRNGRSSIDLMVRGSDRRSPSPGDDYRSPRGNDHSSHDKRELEVDRKPPIPGAHDRALSRSQSRSPNYKAHSRS